jgi:hypothetical protein
MIDQIMSHIQTMSNAGVWYSSIYSARQRTSAKGQRGWDTSKQSTAKSASKGRNQINSNGEDCDSHMQLPLNPKSRVEPASTSLQSLLCLSPPTLPATNNLSLSDVENNLASCSRRVRGGPGLPASISSYQVNIQGMQVSWVSESRNLIRNLLLFALGWLRCMRRVGVAEWKRGGNT